MFKTKQEIEELKLFINEMEQQHKRRIQELETVEKENKRRIEYLQKDIVALSEEISKIQNEKVTTNNK